MQTRTLCPATIPPTIPRGTWRFKPPIWNCESPEGSPAAGTAGPLMSITWADVRAARESRTIPLPTPTQTTENTPTIRTSQDTTSGSNPAPAK